MSSRPPALHHDPDDAEESLWFLPGPTEEAPQPPGPRSEPAETAILADWTRAEAGLAARLARSAARFGALDERLRRGPEGWRHRLALIEAADLSWQAGDRIPADRLAQWIALHLSGVQDDTAALARAGWAVRRLTGGPGPQAGLADFLGRHVADGDEAETESFDDCAGNWLDLMAAAQALHPISRACMGYHLWALAGLGQADGVEAAVTAARVAAGEAAGAVFAPLALGGAGLRVSGPPETRLAHWLDGIDRASLAAMRHLEAVEAWTTQATAIMAPLSGRTPPALRAVLADWPLVSAPMAATLTGASRAAVQRNLTWMQANGLIHEVTGQGRFRMWRALLPGSGRG